MVRDAVPSEVSEDLVKILFRLEKDEDGYPPEDVESLWAIPVVDGFQLDNIPFFVRGVAYGDVVSANRADDGALEFEGVVRRGGHSTYRLLLEEDEELQATVAELERLGLGVESDVGSLLAVDVPHDVDETIIRDHFFEGFDAERWEVEEAYRASR
ncbi:MAG TPA: DUF4265 domain-containing protein [Thermoanaerobaculia bacterium]|nr:DUF4265 domain-containing protein [Thermoanaerobaculia bacterium]